MKTGVDCIGKIDYVSQSNRINLKKFLSKNAKYSLVLASKKRGYAALSYVCGSRERPYSFSWDNGLICHDYWGGFITEQ